MTISQIGFFFLIPLVSFILAIILIRIFELIKVLNPVDLMLTIVIISGFIGIFLIGLGL